MKLYQLEYEIQNKADLETRLSNSFGEPEKTDQGIVFKHKPIDFFRKKYIYNDNQRELIEQGIVSPIYSICTVVLAAVVFLRGIGLSIDSTAISISLSVIYTLGGLTLFLLPVFLMNIKPDVFFPDELIHELFQTSSTLPVVFRRQVSVSPVVYLNGLTTLILAAPIIMPRLSITIIPLLIILTVALPLLTRSWMNPATNQVLTLAIWSTWPFGLTLGNLQIHSQRPSFTEQEQQVLMAMETLPFFTDEMGGAVPIFVETPVIRLIIGNLLFVLLLLYLTPKAISSIIDEKDVYKTSSLITDQLFLRLGVCSILVTYLAFPLFILVSYLLGFHIIHFEFITEILTIYLPLIVIIPLSVIGWIRSNRKEKNQIRELIRSSEQPLLHVEHVPVITADIGSSAAFSTPKIDGQQYIVINEDLEDQLDREELLAMCYHELYHLENKTHRLQMISELPIVGYLLFFVFVNPTSIHEEEFRADDYAAKNVGRDAITSALEKTESENLGPSISPVKQFVHEEGRWVAFKLFWKAPILPLYRPERRMRIDRLEVSN